MSGLLQSPGGVYADWVLPFLDDALALGQRAALVTLIGVTGSSPRSVGSQLAVREDGACVGLISGGCVEPSLALDAVRAINERRCHLERYGQGSRFIDIRLPCGSGIDVYFDIGVTREMSRKLMEARQRRIPMSMVLDMSTHRRWLVEGSEATGKDRNGRFLRGYTPPCRIVMAGAGHVMLALAQMCRLCEIEVDLISTDRLTCQMLEMQGFSPRLLNAWAHYAWQKLDRWSGAVLLSHDHDDETGVLAATLETPAFYIGALGSRRTHARRCDLLREAGLTPDAIARVKGPVGLSIGAVTPPEIAAAILGEIVAHWRSTLSDKNRPASHPETAWPLRESAMKETS